MNALAYLTSTGRDLARGLVHLLYPGTCVVCGRLLTVEQSHFCGDCRTALTADPQPSCQRCAASVGPFVDTTTGCLRCRSESFHFERVLRLGPYEGLLRQTILRMKRLRGELLADPLGDALAERLRPLLAELRPEVVIPIPLHWWRRLQRGYNQSEALARRLASCLRLPCRPSWLRRIRYTPSQRQQSPTTRRENVRGAFRAWPHAGLTGRTILLVDDVLTTGSTASEAAGALRAVGAARVIVVVLGR
jgi:ComF family protein